MAISAYYDQAEYTLLKYTLSSHNQSISVFGMQVGRTMFTLRCTHKLLKRMNLTVADLKDAQTPEPTTALGDWYAHLLILRRQHLVLFVSDRSRLCILTTARDMDRLTRRFTTALRQLLQDIHVPEALMERELAAMGEMCYGLTTVPPNGRSVLGTINDLTNALRYEDLSQQTLFDVNLHFSDWLCAPLHYKHPRDVAHRLLAATWAEEAIAAREE